MLKILEFTINYTSVSVFLLEISNPCNNPSINVLALLNSIRSIKINCASVDSILTICIFIREETEIIEGEVVEIQIDRPASGTVSNLRRNVMLCCKPGDVDVDVFLIQ